MLRKLVFLIIIITGCLPCAAQTQRGEKAVGVSVGYATRNESMSVGLGLSYAFSSQFRLNPQADYIFKHSGQDGFIFNIDAEMPLQLGGTKCYFYPLLGLSYTSWNQHIQFQDLDTSQRVNRLGVNIGGGLEYYIKPPMKIFFEGKWNAVKRYNTGLFTMGIAYIF